VWTGVSYNPEDGHLYTAVRTSNQITVFVVVLSVHRAMMNSQPDIMEAIKCGRDFCTHCRGVNYIKVFCRRN
jgi:hypothetical protein